MSTKITAKQVVGLLWQRHVGKEWAFWPELSTATGFSPQRIDAFAMALWPSSGFDRYAYEVKVSRGDFLKEKKNPIKTRAAYLMSNYFSFVAPMGMIKPEELPLEAGLIEVDAEGRLHDTVPAPYRDVSAPNVLLMAAVCRRANAVEKKQIEEMTLQYIEGKTPSASYHFPLADWIEQLGEQRKKKAGWHHVEKIFVDDEAKRVVNTMLGEIVAKLTIKILGDSVILRQRGEKG